MNVYIANFGRGNWAWHECKQRDTIAVMDDMRVHPYWQRGDREGYIKAAIRLFPTRKGGKQTPSVASRWFGVNTILHETEGDLWIHRDKEQLWWTISSGEQPEKREQDDPAPVNGPARIAVYHKLCNPWSNQNKMGEPLLWANIHPKARNFLVTASTFQMLHGQNAAFALALIDGVDLSHWCNLPQWRAKAGSWGKGAEIAQMEEERRMRQTAARMIKTAQQTAMQSGQEVLSVTKDKRFLFPSDAAAQDYALDLMKKQEGRCALTGLKMLLDDEPGDDQCRYSLDRIDSSRHYKRGNLQVVCKFVNQWKGAMANEEFKRLIAKIRG